MATQPKLILGPIIGGLSHECVNLWGRAGGPGTLYAWLASGIDLRDTHLAGKTQLSEANGYCGVVAIENLEPEHIYFFALTLTPNLSPSKEAYRPLKTFPAPGATRPFRFAFGSCFRPGRTAPGRAFRHILDNQPDLDFLILAGDQIYADAWKYNGLGYAARTLEDYRAVYFNTWSNRYHRELLARTPVFMTLDDHEVDNDWHFHDRGHSLADIPAYTRALRWVTVRPKDERQLTTQRARAGLKAYQEHQSMHAPSLSLPETLENGSIQLVAREAGSTAYSFFFGAAAFFVLDTRTQRVMNSSEQIMLGEVQWRALEAWLLAVKDTFPLKFIVTSSAILFEMWGDFARDRWSGFPKERDRLLYFLAANGVTGVYFLAGDLHEAHTISAELYGPQGCAIPLWEFSATPFEQDTNWAAKLLKRKPRTAAVHNAKIHYSIARINYGVVDVNFDDPLNPAVRFDLYYEDEGQWKLRSIKTLLK